MNIKHFENVNTIEELKKEYRMLSKKFHPDMNRDNDTTSIMVEINNEYEFLFKRLENESTKKAGHTVNDSFRSVIDKLMKYDSINIDIIGSWLWIDGNTFSIKDTLKELGFKFQGKSKKWYLGELSTKRKNLH